MNKRIVSVWLILVLLALPAPVNAGRLKNQAVTWADFNYVNSIASSLTHVYFATTGGITRFNKLENRWELPLTGADGLENERAVMLWAEKFDEYLYVRTDVGLYEYDRLFDRWYPIDELPNFDASGRHISTPEDLLPSTGINFIDRNRLIDEYSRSFDISDIFDDRSGNLWVGTWGYGVGQAGSSARQLELLPYGLLQNQVNALFLYDSILFISGSVGNSYRSGVSVFSLSQNEFSYLESGPGHSFPATDITCLYADDSAIYIGTLDGLYVADRQYWQTINHYGRRQGLADYEIRSLAKLGDTLFVGTSRGLNLLDLTNDSVTYVYPSQFLNRTVYDLDLIGEYLWIASDLGAHRLSLATAKLQRFEDPHDVLFAAVFDIEHSKQQIWFASDGGVLRLNLETGETDPFRDLMRQSGGRALAVNETIAAVASDRGLIVIFHNGEDRFSRDFTTEDGLASDMVYSLLLDGDYIWVGTDLGLTRFLWNNPERID